MNLAKQGEPLIYDVFSLNSISGEKFQLLREKIYERMGEFECEKSPHIQEFARQKVTNYERHGHSRTYVLINPIGDDDIDVAGFFSVGMEVLDFRKVSNSLKRKLKGNFTEVNMTASYLIAELARSDKYNSIQLPGSKILDEAKNVISSARSHVGGRYLMVDCQSNIFDGLYQPAGFKVIGEAQSPIAMPESNFVRACAVIKDW